MASIIPTNKHTEATSASPEPNRKLETLNREGKHVVVVCGEGKRQDPIFNQPFQVCSGIKVEYSVAKCSRPAQFLLLTYLDGMAR